MNRIRHIGVLRAICGCGVPASLRDDLDYFEYSQMGRFASTRFSDEAPFTICARCCGVIRKRENRLRQFTGRSRIK